jgi:hypothetical protein
MPQEDYLLRHINLLSFLLRGIIQKLIGGTSDLECEDVLASAEINLKQDLGFDFETIHKIPSDEIVSFLLKNPHFNPENLELFADLLQTVASHKLEYQSDFNKKALLIYKHLDNVTAAFSFERNEKMKVLQSNS